MKKTVMYGGLAALLLAAGFVWWFLGREGPAAADLSATAEAVSTDSTAGGTTAAPDTLDGTWTVDTSIGTFSVDDPTSTFVGFRVAEELRGLGAVTAVGRTGDVSGSISVAGTSLDTGQVDVDLTGMVSNDSRREDNIQDALNTTTNPTATFVITESAEFGDGLLDGAIVTTTVIGDLTINGVTNSVQMPVEAQLVDGSVLVVGSIDVVFADYDVEVPSSQIVVSVEDEGVLEVQIWLSRA